VSYPQLNKRNKREKKGEGGQGKQKGKEIINPPIEALAEKSQTKHGQISTKPRGGKGEVSYHPRNQELIPLIQTRILWIRSFNLGLNSSGRRPDARIVL